jgi:hypothetical protein
MECRFAHLYKQYFKYPQVKNYYDYSMSNIEILHENNITNTIHFPYLLNDSENKFLKDIRMSSRVEYDFGIICSGGHQTNEVSDLEPPRRKKVIQQLIDNGFSINIISGWGKNRDIELGKCNKIINLHGEFANQTSMIFEHLRCNRLLDAGYSILSEESVRLSSEFVNKYPKLEFISYSDFFNLKNDSSKYSSYLNLEPEEVFEPEQSFESEEVFELNTQNTQNTQNIESLSKMKDKFICKCIEWSDIYEHLPTLYNYSLECDSIFETGVRGCVSSWAFAYGLATSNTTNTNNTNTNTKKRKKYLLNDIDDCTENISELYNLCKEVDIDISYIWFNNLKIEFIETFDLTFIDTWHVYGQLKRELEKYSKITNKYIIMHDTTVDEWHGENARGGHDDYLDSQKSGIPIEEIRIGLWPAIEEFLLLNKDWVLHERFTNNNGLTILKKV